MKQSNISNMRQSKVITLAMALCLTLLSCRNEQGSLADERKLCEIYNDQTCIYDVINNSVIGEPTDANIYNAIVAVGAQRNLANTDIEILMGEYYVSGMK